ncbi:MAG TPA: tyrosine-type recombinase/integrase [Candidatus Acidoferrales bacterium]|nr:tyrosine-type recombinase/integrase [Candidatus Acidoferrales bacterium]
MRIPKVSLYRRMKKAGKGYRYIRINLGPGRRPTELAPPFYLRFTAQDGSQPWNPVSGPLEAAIAARDKFQAMLEAKARGVTVPELDAENNANRTLITEAVRKFLESKARKAKSTVKAYTLHLNEFLLFIGRKKKYLDEIGADDLRGFMAFMHKKGHQGKTQYNRVLTVLFLLKRNGIPNPLPWDDMPTIEEDPAIPYTPDELQAVFAAMDGEERARYSFFLGTAARDQEVKFAAWTDIDFHARIFRIRKKDDVEFYPKNHEARDIPIPESLVKALQARKKNPPHDRWIFVNEDGSPDGHFLRKLKRITLKAGLNCGHCTRHVQVGRGRAWWLSRSEAYKRKQGKRLGLSEKEIEAWLERDRKSGKEAWEPSEFWMKEYGAKTPEELLLQMGQKKTVSCKAHPVCEQWILHRFRKTCATRWHENGIPVRTIQKWLGHKKLETTVKYLGLADLKDPKTRAQVDASFAGIL